MVITLPPITISAWTTIRGELPTQSNCRWNHSRWNVPGGGVFVTGFEIQFGSRPEPEVETEAAAASDTGTADAAKPNAGGHQTREKRVEERIKQCDRGERRRCEIDRTPEVTHAADQVRIDATRAAEPNLRIRCDGPEVRIRRGDGCLREH